MPYLRHFVGHANGQMYTLRPRGLKLVRSDANTAALDNDSPPGPYRRGRSVSCPNAVIPRSRRNCSRHLCQRHLAERHQKTDHNVDDSYPKMDFQKYPTPLQGTGRLKGGTPAQKCCWAGGRVRHDHTHMARLICANPCTFRRKNLPIQA